MALFPISFTQGIHPHPFFTYSGMQPTSPSAYQLQQTLLPVAHHASNFQQIPAFGDSKMIHNYSTSSTRTFSDSQSSSHTGSQLHIDTDNNPKMTVYKEGSDYKENEIVRTNLIVNYIPPDMTENEFGRMFMAYGSVESIKLVKERGSNSNLGYGFVRFTRSEDAERAMKSMNGLKIANKEIKVSYARPSSADIKDANLYVGSLPSFVATSNDLEALFRPYGRIVTVRLLLDKDYKPKGIGFVRFNLKIEAQRAINYLNGAILEGCQAPLLVKFARNACRKREELRFHAPPFTPRQGPCRGSVLYVNNLGEEVNESALVAIFSQYGQVVDLSIVRNHWNKRKNYAFVTMETVAAADMARRMINGQQFGSKRIYISFKEQP